jgi:hypothetical protein
MVAVVIIIIFIISIVAIIFLSRIFKPQDPFATFESSDGESTSKKQEIILWGNVDRIASEARHKIELNVSSAVSSVNEVIDGFIDNLENEGMQIAEEVITSLNQIIKEDLEETSWLDRIGFDIKVYVEQGVVPRILYVYDIFKQEKIKELRELIENKIGSSLEKLVAPNVAYVNEEDNDESDNPLKDIAIGFVGGAAGGAAAAFLGGPITIAIIALIGIFSYKSKNEIQNKVIKSCRPLIRGLFSETGYRNPEDGTTIPSAVVWLTDQATRFREKINRKIEDEGEKQKIRIETRKIHLKNLCESGNLSWQKLKDLSFISTYLLSEEEPYESRKGKSRN